MIAPSFESSSLKAHINIPYGGRISWGQNILKISPGDRCSGRGGQDLNLRGQMILGHHE